MYCKYCGKKLKDGQKCTCSRAKKAEQFFQEDYDEYSLFYDEDEIVNTNRKSIITIKIIGIAGAVAAAVIIGLMLGVVIPQKYFGENSESVAVDENDNENQSIQDENAIEEDSAEVEQDKKNEEEKKKEEEEKKKEEEEKKKEEEKTYILAESDKRLLTDTDIKDLSVKQLNYAKNEIYARHGRMFNSKELQDYFNSKSWYTGNVAPGEFDESCLSQIERANVDKLYSLEMSKESGGYQLDAN